MGTTRHTGTAKVSDIDAAWDRYFAERSTENRNRLVVHYGPLVKVIAGKVSAGLGHNRSVDDLMSDGMFGLMQTIERFDPASDAKFETFATYRIKGAMFDSVRHLDWAPRTVRNNTNRLASAEDALRQRAGREDISNREIAAFMDEPVEKVVQTRSEHWAAALGSTDAPRHSGSESTQTVGDIYVDLNAPNSESIVLEAEEREELHSVLDALPDHLSFVLRRYYFDGWTLQEIADELAVSESRVCQIKKVALDSIRTKTLRPSSVLARVA